LGTTQIQGFVSIISHDGGEAKNAVCHGYLASAASNEPYHVVIVLDVDGKMTPCLCPRYLIDFEIPASVQYIENKRANNNRATAIVTANNILVKSKPAQREDGVHGQLIVDGPLKGRVVDETMLESLNGGCLRGIDSKRAFYTIDRRYTINERMLKNAAMVIIASQSDGMMKLTPVGRDEVASIISIAQLVLRCKSVRHETMLNAIIELQRAGSLPPPSLNETLLQISMGGDSSPQAMMIGQFLPCAGLSAHPDIAVRCACGFTVDGMKKGKDMLRRNCKKHINNNIIFCISSSLSLSLSSNVCQFRLVVVAISSCWIISESITSCSSKTCVAYSVELHFSFFHISFSQFIFSQIKLKGTTSELQLIPKVDLAEPPGRLVG
jgi:hypothetical protein